MGVGNLVCLGGIGMMILLDGRGASDCRIDI